MAKKKKSLLPSLEILIILVFFLSFIMFASSKCQATKKSIQDKINMEQAEVEETPNAEADISALVEPAVSPTPTTTTTAAVPSLPQTTTATPSIIRERYTPLYITIDSLKMRAEPSLNAGVIMKLPLFEEVIFLNELTDSTEQINIGYEVADEPWVKVQHRRGQVGWVYGAGVSYYKRKRVGVY